jgi:hypothetical protein
MREQVFWALHGVDPEGWIESFMRRIYGENDDCENADERR